MRQKIQQKLSPLAVVGTGYVGLITAVAFTKFGYPVVCVDTDTEKIAKLRRGVVPIYEPGVRELLKVALLQKRLFFTTRYEEAFAVHHPEFVFLCVGTPPHRDGSANLSYLEGATRMLAKNLTRPAVIIIKSTVPVGTARSAQRLLRRHSRVPFTLVSNPEFLREGKALYDFMNPEKIVIGCDDAKTLRRVAALYKPFKAPIFQTTLETSELAKYAQNAFLATEISLANTLAELAERCNADIQTIVASLKLDKRVGPHAYLSPGPGYGGSCLPKDVKALIHFGKSVGVSSPVLLEAVERVNNTRPAAFVKKSEFLVGVLAGKRIAMLGLAFKEGTDDLRLSPAVALAQAFIKKRASITVYDPMAMEQGRRIFGKKIRFVPNAYAAARGSNLVVLATAWPQFKKLRFAHLKRIMHTPNVLDTRNFLPAQKLQKLGFNYLGVGIPYLKGMHPSWLKMLAKDVRKLKKLSVHELRELQEGLRALESPSLMLVSQREEVPPF